MAAIPENRYATLAVAGTRDMQIVEVLNAALSLSHSSSSHHPPTNDRGFPQGNVNCDLGGNPEFRTCTTCTHQAPSLNCLALGLLVD